MKPFQEFALLIDKEELDVIMMEPVNTVEELQEVINKADQLNKENESEAFTVITSYLPIPTLIALVKELEIEDNFFK